MNSLARTGTLVRLALRRDRIILPAWVAVFVLSAVGSAASGEGLFPTEASRLQAAGLANGAPVLVALYGRVYAASVGALSLIKLTGFGAAMLAILAFTLVLRHSRSEEESGRLELLGATPVGRTAPLAAAMIVGVGTSALIGLLCAAGLVVTGLPFGGSLAFGLAWAATGTAFAAVGALTAQLSARGRVAAGMAAAFLGLVYILRAVGDVSGDGGRLGWLTWLSPIGWGQQVRAFAEERWPVLLLLVAFATAVGAIAFGLARRRDLGSGLLADRPGPAEAPRGLSTPFGLAWRLQRGTLLVWFIGFVLLGVIQGSVASEVSGFFESPQARQLIATLGGTQVVIDAYLAFALVVTAMIASAYGILAALAARSEETSNRAEPVLVTPVSRQSWLASHVVIAVGGTAFLVVAGGAAMAFAHAAQVGSLDAAGPVMAGALVQIPAVWVVAAVAVALFGLVPRSSSLAWGALVAFVLIGEIGPLLRLPSWVLDLSPFAHTPRIPGGTLEAVPVAALLGIAAVLLLAGFAAFRRRDLQ